MLNNFDFHGCTFYVAVSQGRCGQIFTTAAGLNQGFRDLVVSRSLFALGGPLHSYRSPSAGSKGQHGGRDR